MLRLTGRNLSWLALSTLAITLGSCEKHGGSANLSALDTAGAPAAGQGFLLADASDIVDLKMRILKAIRGPAATFGFILGYTYATGTGASGLNMGEDMSIVNDPSTAEPTGWQGNYRPTDLGAKANQADKRLEVLLTDWSMQAIGIEYTGDPMVKSLEPVTIDSIEVSNDGDTEVEQTYRVAKTISTTYSYTQINRFHWGTGVTTSFNANVPLLGGGKVDLKLDFSTDHEIDTTAQTINSTTKDATISIPVPAHNKMTVDIIVDKQSCSIPYLAKVKILAHLKYKGLLRYGDPLNPKSRNFHYQYRTSGKDNYYEATFGAGSRTFYEDMASEAVNGGLPWLWEDLWAAWGFEGRSHLNALTNPDNFILPLTGVLTYEDGLKVTYKIKNKTNSTVASGSGGGRPACTSNGGKGFGDSFGCDGLNCAKQMADFSVECIVR